jgi:hypothetical protein
MRDRCLRSNAANRPRSTRLREQQRRRTGLDRRRPPRTRRCCWREEPDGLRRLRHCQSVARCRLWVVCSQGDAAGNCTHVCQFGAALPLLVKLTGQFAQRFGDQARVCQRREVVAYPLCHRPAEFPRLGCLIPVGLAQLQVSGGGIRPLRRRRVNFLEHGPVAARGQPAAKCRRTSGSGMSSARSSSRHHCGQGGRQPWASAISRSGAGRVERFPSRSAPGIGRPASTRCNRGPARCGARGGQQQSCPAMADEDRPLSGCAAGYHLGLARAIRRPCRDRTSEVGDAHLVATPHQASGDQIPGCTPDQRAMNEQQPPPMPIRIHVDHVGRRRPRNRMPVRCAAPALN